MTYDYDQTIELLQRAVAEKGDGHIYERHGDSVLPACRYANHDGTPDCIVGHALSYVDLLSLELDDQGPVTDLKIVHENFTPVAIHALEVAQDGQDCGDTWGEALIAAKGVLE
jgi:hypothetical protein